MSLHFDRTPKPEEIIAEYYYNNGMPPAYALVTDNDRIAFDAWSWMDEQARGCGVSIEAFTANIQDLNLKQKLVRLLRDVDASWTRSRGEQHQYDDDFEIVEGL